MIYEFKIEDIEEYTPFWYVTKNIKVNQKVLDVGCATGYLGAYLKKKLDVDIVGIDNQDYHLEKAKEQNIYSDLVKLDLNSFSNELDNYTSYFDRIVICDVLEHLIDPMAVLKRLSKFLKSDGEFLIDIPNISHASIKYNLLMNNFNYTSIGLLDETHIRFFTLNSIINKLSENNFLIKNIEYTFTAPGQNTVQHVDHAKFPKEIIDYIENDVESAIFQIFIVFKKSDLDLDSILKHNISFKEIKKDILTKREAYAPKNIENPIKTMEETIQERDRYILFLQNNLQEKDNDILKKDNDILNFKKNLQEKDNSIVRLSNNISANNAKIKNLNKIIKEMKGSRSWKITKPIRDFTFILRRLKNRNSSTKKTNRHNKVKKNDFND